MCKASSFTSGANVVRIKHSQGTYKHLVEVEGEWGSFGYGHTVEEAAQRAFFNAVDSAKAWRRDTLILDGRHVARVFLAQARLLRERFQLRELAIYTRRTR